LESSEIRFVEILRQGWAKCHHPEEQLDLRVNNLKIASGNQGLGETIYRLLKKMLENKTAFEQDLEQSLNPAQFEAVCADESIPTCVYSGPGSGKTKVCSSSIRCLTSKRPSHTE